jgi:exonuclease SbcC
MQELHRGKVRAAKQDHKAILLRKELLEQRLVTLQPIDELEQRLSDCESLFETIGSQKKAAEKIAILIEALSAARGKCKFLEKQSLTLQQITSPPLLQPTSPLAKLIHLLASTQHQKQFENAKANALSECRTAPRLLNTSALEKLISQLQTSHTEIALQQQVCNAINPLTSPPKIKNQESIKRSATIVESITSAFDKLQRAKRMIVKLNVALEETNIELGHRIDELGDCPTCGQEIDPEKLIARARLGNDFKLRQQSLPLNSSETFPSEVQP